MTRKGTPDVMGEVLTGAAADDVAVAMGPQAQRVATVHIRLDGGTQPRAGIDQAVVDDYHSDMQAGAQFPPVELVYDGTNYWLWDGFHRFHALRKDGDRLITANVRQGTRRDAVLLSVGANATHGFRRTTQDKQRAIETLLRDPEWSQWSDREIARRCAVDGKTVSARRVALTAEIPQSTERRGADGRTIDTTNIGKRSQAPVPAPQAPSYAAQVDLQLAIGDWLDNFDDPAPIIDELARDSQASILWEDLTASLPPFRLGDLVIAIAAFRQRMAATRKQLAQTDRPPLARPAAHLTRPAAPIVQPPDKDGQTAISRSYVSRMDGAWTFSVWLKTIWTHCTPDQKRQTLLQSAAQLETWADQMREEAADL